MNRKQRRAAARLGQASSGPPGDPTATAVAASVPALVRAGLQHHQAGQLAEAEACYRRVLAAEPNHADALHLLGVIAYQVKRADLAVQLIGQAIKQNGRNAGYFSNLGNALQGLGRFEEALASYDKALALRPDDADAFYNRGSALQELKRFEEALASFDQALAFKPDFAEAFNNRGIVLRALKRFDEALASYDRALALRPGYAEAANNRGVALQELRRFEEALASYDNALTLNPDYAEAFNSRGVVLQELRRLEEALASYEHALARNPDHAHAFSGIMDCVNNLCDWGRKAALTADVRAHVAESKSIISPFVLLGFSGAPSLQLQCAKGYAADKVRSLAPPTRTVAARRHDKVRIAYLSSDFHRHATAYLMAELFERHDRSRFQVTAISFGVDDQSEMRKRLVAAFDQFHDVRSDSDGSIAKLVHDLQVDIAIDLKGYTQNSRPVVLAHRPAPIQVSYLGFPATMGAAFIDYIIADETVAPFEHQAFYTEKIVHLPECYQVNDRKRTIAHHIPTRQAAGLPVQGFVFCCFNQNWKITPDIFDVWMRLLHAVEGSVLWLLGDHESAERRLRNEASARGVEPVRLVFAGRLPIEDHLARHRLADLFLDTLPVNAHTTASDALWAGLPVLTRPGQAFAGRVAASLLKAIGLPELVTHSIADYEALALRLANEPALLEGYRARLTANRLIHPLFDTDRFCRHIEAAYVRMWEMWQRGEPPTSFAIAPSGADCGHA